MGSHQVSWESWLISGRMGSSSGSSSKLILSWTANSCTRLICWFLLFMVLCLLRWYKFTLSNTIWYPGWSWYKSNKQYIIFKQEMMLTDLYFGNNPYMIWNLLWWKNLGQSWKRDQGLRDSTYLYKAYFMWVPLTFLHHQPLEHVRNNHVWKQWVKKTKKYETWWLCILWSLSELAIYSVSINGSWHIG